MGCHWTFMQCRYIDIPTHFGIWCYAMSHLWKYIGKAPIWHTRTSDTFVALNIAWASYQIRKIARCACAGNAGNVFPRRRFQRKPLVSDPGMHHGTCVTHVPWCMSGSLTRGDRENVPGIPGACAPTILPIWQEANSIVLLHSQKGLVWLTDRCHNTKRHQATYCCAPCYMLLVGQT